MFAFTYRRLGADNGSPRHKQRAERNASWPFIRKPKTGQARIWH